MIEKNNIWILYFTLKRIQLEENIYIDIQKKIGEIIIKNLNSDKDILDLDWLKQEFPTFKNIPKILCQKCDSFDGKPHYIIFCPLFIKCQICLNFHKEFKDNCSWRFEQCKYCLSHFHSSGECDCGLVKGYTPRCMEHKGESSHCCECNWRLKECLYCRSQYHLSKDCLSFACFQSVYDDEEYQKIKLKKNDNE